MWDLRVPIGCVRTGWKGSYPITVPEMTQPIYKTHRFSEIWKSEKNGEKRRKSAKNADFQGAIYLDRSTWSEWHGSNLRHRGPKQLTSVFFSFFSVWAFLVPFQPVFCPLFPLFPPAIFLVTVKYGVKLPIAPPHETRGGGRAWSYIRTGAFDNIDGVNQSRS